MPKKKKKSTGQLEDDFGPSYVMPQEAWLVGIGFRFITGKLIDIIDDGKGRSVKRAQPDNSQGSDVDAKKAENKNAVEKTESKNQIWELHICDDQSVKIQYNKLTTVLIGDPDKGHMVTATTYANNSTALCIERLL